MSFVAMKSLDDLLWLASRCLGSEYRKVAEAKKNKKKKNNRRSGMKEREARFVRQARRRSVITELFPLRLSRLTRCVFSSWLINRSTRNTDRRTSRRMDAWSGQKILGISTWIFIFIVGSLSRAFFLSFFVSRSFSFRFFPMQGVWTFTEFRSRSFYWFFSRFLIFE